MSSSSLRSTFLRALEARAQTFLDPNPRGDDTDPFFSWISSVDKSAISFHLLNGSRGPAGWGHRAQMSRTDYKRNMQEALSKVENLEVQAGSVSNLLWAQGPDGWKVEGVRLGEF